MWQPPAIVLLLVLTASCVLASEEAANPIISVRVESADVVDLNRVGGSDDIVLHVSMQILVELADPPELVVLLTLPSGQMIETDTDLIVAPSGLVSITIILFDQAVESGWYSVQIRATHDEFQRLSESFLFDPVGGSSGPSGQ